MASTITTDAPMAYFRQRDADTIWKTMSSSLLTKSATVSEDAIASPTKSTATSMAIDGSADAHIFAGEEGARVTRYKRKRHEEDVAMTDNKETVRGIVLSNTEYETLPKRSRKVAALLSPSLFSPKWRKIVALSELRYDIASYPWGENEINLDIFFQHAYGNAIRALNNMSKALRALMGYIYAPNMAKEKLQELTALLSELFAIELRLTPDMPKTSLAFDVAVKNLTRIVHYAAAHLSHRVVTPRYVELVTIVCMKMDESYCHLSSLNILFSTMDSHIQRSGRRL